MMEEKEQRLKQYFRELGEIHNNICLGKDTQESFTRKLDEILDSGLDLRGYNGFLSMCAHRMQPNDEWIENNLEFFDLCEELFKRYTDEDLSSFGFRAGIQLAMLESVIENTEALRKKVGD